ncbi:MAG: hypothetical protein JSV04_10935 [Candidatus Heimdallarchaeota archaeon]|nr:MAG: hypothetical protein JSV04_10935 [Candidatus Heimdallarchaeota archaeon]
MIWNFHIVVELLLGILTLLLSGYGAYIAFKIWRFDESQNSSKERENYYYLLSMIAIILLVSRSINVFYFYFVLVSLVPVIPGSMCPYGVLDASIFSSGFFDLGIKLFVPFIYCVWLLLDLINKRTKNLNLSVILSKGYSFVLFPALLVDAGLDWIYFWFSETIQVNCCRNILNEAGGYSPLQILGSETAFIAFLIMVFLIFGIIIFQYYQNRRPFYSTTSLILAILAIPIVLITVQEFIAPVWIFASKSLLNQPLGEPHHCPFCLIKRWWTMIPFLLLIWLGLASVGWQVIIRQVVQKNIESVEKAQPILNNLRFITLFSLTGGLLILFGHIGFFLLFDLT